MPYLLFAAVCLLGQFLQTTLGFGLNILVMALCSAAFSVNDLAGACIVLSFASCLCLAIRWRTFIRWRIILWPLITLLACSAAAILTIRLIPVDLLRGILGVVLMGLSVFLLAVQGRLHIRPSRANGLLTGCAAGIMGGYFAISGPPLATYLLSAVDDKESYLASIQTCFLLANVWTLLFRGAAGYLNTGVLLLCAAGAPGIAVGAWLGTRALHRLNFARVRLTVNCFIGLCGAWIAWSAFAA